MACKKLMVVDDDREFLEELRDILSLSGYEIVEVSDTDKFLETASNIKPDAIIMDIKMPGKSGFELANELRQSADLGPTPIIAMSAYFKEEYAPLMNICGIKTCLKKPFNPLDVIAQIEGALQEK